MIALPLVKKLPTCYWRRRSLPYLQEVQFIFGTGAAIWSKTNFGPNGHHHPQSSLLLRICTVPSTSAIFFNTSWKLFSVRVSAILLPSPHCGNRKAGWVRDYSHVVLGEVWNDMLSWYNSPFLCHWSLRQSLCTFSVAIKCHSSVWNWRFGLPGWFICEQSP
jgi:hypothetical protein